jgi:hypothetical protein
MDNVKTARRVQIFHFQPLKVQLLHRAAQWINGLGGVFIGEKEEKGSGTGRQKTVIRDEIVGPQLLGNREWPCKSI